MIILPEIEILLMKKKKFKPNLPSSEIINDRTRQNTSFNSANEELYNKFIEEERIDHKKIPKLKTLSD